MKRQPAGAGAIVLRVIASVGIAKAQDFDTRSERTTGIFGKPFSMALVV